MIVTSKPHQPKSLNPQAPHFFPNHHFTHFPNTYPLFNPLPPPPPFFNIFYGHQIFPFFPPKFTELPMLPDTEPGVPNSSQPGCTEAAGDEYLVMLGSSTTTVSSESNDLAGPGSMVVRKVRKPKRSKAGRVPSSGMWFWSRKDVIYHPVALAADYPFGDSTSLMIRNIPVRFSRKELMERLDEHCRKENEEITSHDEPEPASEFDFLYLPIDFKTKGNLGYAFVNFTTWQGGARLFSSWNGSPWENCPYKTKKICQINRARFQGKHDLRRHFEMSVFPCETDEYLPVVISPPRNGFNADQTSLATIGTLKFK